MMGDLDCPFLCFSSKRNNESCPEEDLLLSAIISPVTNGRRTPHLSPTDSPSASRATSRCSPSLPLHPYRSPANRCSSIETVSGNSAGRSKWHLQYSLANPEVPLTPDMKARSEFRFGEAFDDGQQLPLSP
eukprot:Rmarinus@m.13246